MRIKKDDIYNEINDLISSYELESIIKVASEMDLDINKLFYEYISGNIKKEDLQNNLLGVFGNFLAKKHYQEFGYLVESEVPIYDDKRNELTKADLLVKTSNNETFFCEVKTSFQIIDNIRNFKDDSEKYKGKYYYDMDNEILKYKKIGEKLLKQVRRLSMYNKNIIVVIFEGCYMDEIIKDKIIDLGARIDKIKPNVDLIQKVVNKFVDQIIKGICKEKEHKLC